LTLRLGGGLIDHKIFDEIILIENLFLAWKKFVRGKRGKKDVQEFELYLEDNLFLLHSQLADGTWKHGGYKSFNVCDPKSRQIHKASVADRVIHHAIVRVIEPIFDKSFIFDCWSCRQGKGTHGAVLRCHELLDKLHNHNRNTVWILKCDIKKYFASINHEILLELLDKKISDDRALCLLDQIVASFCLGIPLGNLTSQLFANIYLNSFDHFVKEQLRVKIYLRYCDDFLLASLSKRELKRNLREMRDFLSDKLKLSLHPNKITIRPYHWGIDWLGYVLYPSYRVLRACSRKRMWRNVERKAKLYLGGDGSREEMRSVFASYMGMTGFSWNDEDRKKLNELYKILS